MCSTWVSECDTSDIGKKTIFLWTEVKREGTTKQVLNTIPGVIEGTQYSGGLSLTGRMPTASPEFRLREPPPKPYQTLTVLAAYCFALFLVPCVSHLLNKPCDSCILKKFIKMVRIYLE